jgi:xylulokinase
MRNLQSHQKLILAVDIGTTAMKGGLITSEGELVAYHRVTYWEKTRQDFHAWDPKVWVEALREIVASVGGYQRISAVAVSGHGPTVIPVDAEGRVLFYALLWMDKRNLRQEGTKSFFLPKIAWFRQNHPELYQKTQWFLSCPEYLNFFLTGEALTVTPSKEFIPYIWHGADWRAYGLDYHKLPPFVRMGEKVGEVSQQASTFTGIPAGVPVVAAGSDFLVALVGAGAVEPGRTCDRAGTSEGINYCSALPVADPRLRTLPHAIDGLYNISGILSSTGRLFEWLRRITGQSDRSYREILQEIENLSLDRNRPYFFPSFERNGDFEFAQGGFLELHPDHTREDMGRAVVESIAFGIRRVLETLGENGCPVDEMRVTGGQARNVIWNQIKADITGKRVLVPEIEDAELLGSAACALVFQGEYNSLREASAELVKVRAVFNPRAERLAVYDELYAAYRDYGRTMGL